jgi:hypothetical protein
MNLYQVLSDALGMPKIMKHKKKIIGHAPTQRAIEINQLHFRNKYIYI